MSNLVMGALGEKLLKNGEGYSGTAYWDKLGGVWTIGWGDTNTHQGATETEAQAEANFKRDMLAYGKTVNQSIHVPINQNQFDAMVDLCYNIGQSPTKGFPSSSVVRDFNAGNLSKVPSDFLLWNKAGGKVSQGLINRRNAEIKVFLTPVSASNPTPTKTNNNTNAAKDAAKKAAQQKASADLAAKNKAADDKKAAAIKAQQALDKAKQTKNADAIKAAQKAVDDQKKNSSVIPKQTATPTEKKKFVLKSGMGFAALIATAVILKNGYDL